MNRYMQFWLATPVIVWLLVAIPPAHHAPPLTAPLTQQGVRTLPSDAENGFVIRSYTDFAGRTMTYYLHVPPFSNANPGAYPLVLLLHGGGERGSSGNPPEQNRAILVDNLYVKQWTSDAVQQAWPSFIVVPQVMDDHRWVTVPADQGDYRLAPQPTPELLLAREIVARLQQQYVRIDPGRIYITGISMGGYGVWDAIERWPGVFAAAAPVSGAGDPTHAGKLLDLPIWAFHGASDGTPPVTATQAMIQAIRAVGGHPRFTEYPQAAHDIWLQVYTMPAFLEWLFAQKCTQCEVEHFADVAWLMIWPLMLATVLLGWVLLLRRHPFSTWSPAGHWWPPQNR